jgi:putative aldouronate transport system substrate-binding protein
MKRFIAVGALFVFTLAMAFAGGGTQGGGSTGTTGTTGKEVLSAPGVLPITQEKSNMDVFMVYIPTDYPDLATNPVLVDFEKATNVHLNITQAVEEDAGEKLNLLLSSGQYPEVITKAGGVPASDLIKYGTVEKMFIPINDLIDKHAPHIREQLTKYPWIRESMTSSDGNLYGIPRVDAGAKGLPNVSINMWMNLAWLDKLGLKIPATTEEFRNVLRAFKTMDPNGNGKADEIPLSGATNTWNADPWLYLLNAFGYYQTNLVALRNDTFIPVADQDYIREGLKYIKTLYDEGLLDPASLTQPLEQLIAIGNNAEILLGSYSAGHLAMAVSNMDEERAAMYDNIAPLMGPTGYRGIPVGDPYARPTSAAFIITDKCKNPALAIKWADAWRDDYWELRGRFGTEGKAWVFADPNSYGWDGVTQAKYKLLNVDWGTNSYKETLSFRLIQEISDSDNQIVGPLTASANYGSRMMKSYAKYGTEYAADVQIVPPLNYDANSSARLAQISTALTDFVNTSFVEFITGRANLDTGWNTYKQDLQRLGYSEYVKIMQDAYNAQK